MRDKKGFTSGGKFAAAIIIIFAILILASFSPQIDNWKSYLSFQNPEGLAIGVFIILFVISYSILSKFLKEKGINLIISFMISLIAARQLYKNRFFEWEASLAVMIIVIIAFILFKVFSSFFKFNRLNRGR